MSIYPRGRLKLLPEAASQRPITATQIIWHTAVSDASSLYPYFSRPDIVLESHFYNSETLVEQYVDTSRSADANYLANVRAISIESWDGGHPETTPWTDDQMDRNIDLGVWLCQTHHIPARQCRSWSDPGIGWHSMWGAPSQWTPVPGKTCPAGPRIRQMPTLIREIALRINPPPAPIEEDYMECIYDCTGRPAIHFAAGTARKINRDQRDFLRSQGVDAKKVDTDTWDTIASFAEA